MGKAIRKCDVRRVATVASMAAILGVAMVREARAGCNDGACGRVDWTEVTDVDQGTPAAAKLHGAYAWEASSDGWATHPIGGAFAGYLWVSCRPAGGAADATCEQALAAEMAKAGSSSMITFGGGFFSPDAGVIQPPGLFRETQDGIAALYGRDLQLGGAPFNPQVCPAAFAIARNGADAAVPDATAPTDATPPDDAQGSGGAATGSGGGTAAGSGGTAGKDPASGGAAGAPVSPTSKDDGGCAVSSHAVPRPVGLIAFAWLAATIALARRRRTRD
jgi:hypothetical protein